MRAAVTVLPIFLLNPLAGLTDPRFAGATKAHSVNDFWPGHTFRLSGRPFMNLDTSDATQLSTNAAACPEPDVSKR
jgi:hypothetical protein